MENIISALSEHYILTIVLFALGLMWFGTTVALRRVVASNEVHIVQYRKRTISYGKDQPHGNVYYEWPTWMPLYGITKTELPVSVFPINLDHYDAYDEDRVPFEVDIVAFFRINDTNVAAGRTSDFNNLCAQLTNIVRGAVRKVLAQHPLDRIMKERSVFGEAFTEEVKSQLPQWGVEAVKNIELMDIRDSKGNQAIHNIMQKKQSFIEMESRTVVAKNMRDASIAEIQAERDAEVEKQNASRTIGLQEANREQEVGIAKQKASQVIKEQEKLTQEQAMAVARVNQVKQAEINRDVNVTIADQEKKSAVLVAEGRLQTAKLNAEGMIAEGKARGEAEQAILMAPVNAQTALAEKIGANEKYQQYLLSSKTIEATRDVGIEQAKALEKADVKIIANAGEPVEGVTSVMDLLSAKGGTKLGAMLEALANTGEGKKVIDKITAPKK